MARLFISYRREDTGIAAAWLYQKLVDRFGSDDVFIDIDTIEVGKDFDQEIKAHLQKARVLLAIIGRHWSQATDSQGRRRLGLPHDFVRFEIATAMQMGIRVIPILVDTAAMPSAADLPLDLADLSKKQAVRLGQDHFEYDTQQLVNRLDRILQGQDDAVDITSSAALLAEYLKRQVEVYNAQEWTRRALLLLTSANSTPFPKDAREQLRTWAVEGKDSVAFLIGEFGSGKTWLARWLACDLAQHYDEMSLIPLTMYLGTLDKRLASFDELVRSEVGQPVPGGRFLVILDGLDELVASAGDSEGLARDYFSHLISIIPTSVPILITCRTQVFTVLSPWLSRLFSHRVRRDGMDRTAEAVRLALAKGSNPDHTVSMAVVFEIRDVTQQQADDYLSRSKAAQIWDHLKAQPAYQGLARLPFTLFLLEEALPKLAEQTGTPELPDLYKAAVVTWLVRDRHASQSDLNALQERLEEVAQSFLRHSLRQQGPYDDLLIKIGLLRLTNGLVDFMHYSMFEYFLARAAVREICAYNSDLLSRLNLVYMYNVNRFMIPMLRHGLSDFCENAPSRVDRFADASATIQLPGGRLALAHRVTSGQYEVFVRVSGWRERLGYGYWPTLETPDGTAAMKGDVFSGMVDLDKQKWLSVTPSLDNRSAPCTGMSWYDAFQFCRWVGGRLPTLDELHLLRMEDPTETNAGFEWTSSWLDERQALIAVMSIGSPASFDSGLNPDLRSEHVGFRVIWDSYALSARRLDVIGE